MFRRLVVWEKRSKLLFTIELNMHIFAFEKLSVWENVVRDVESVETV